MAKKIAFQFDDELNYQLKAIHSTVELFRGLPRQVDGIYRANRAKKLIEGDPVRNQSIITGSRLLQNLRQVQLDNKLFADHELESNNFTIEMETGERVIIVMGAINVLKSRVSGTFTEKFLCIAYSN